LPAMMALMPPKEKKFPRGWKKRPDTAAREAKKERPRCRRGGGGQRHSPRSEGGPGRGEGGGGNLGGTQAIRGKGKWKKSRAIALKERSLSIQERSQLAGRGKGKKLWGAQSRGREGAFSTRGGKGHCRSLPAIKKKRGVLRKERERGSLGGKRGEKRRNRPVVLQGKGEKKTTEGGGPYAKPSSYLREGGFLRDHCQGKRKPIAAEIGGTRLAGGRGGISMFP